MVYGPSGKRIIATMEYTLVVYNPMEKARLYEKLFFKVIIVMVKVIKYSIKDTVSIKISFMHYMKRTRVVMATVVLEELEESDVFLFFFATFIFSVSPSIGKT